MDWYLYHFEWVTTDKLLKSKTLYYIDNNRSLLNCELKRTSDGDDSRQHQKNSWKNWDNYSTKSGTKQCDSKERPNPSCCQR